MHLIDAAGHVDNQFVHEDPNTNRPPTEIDAAWLNSVQNEIASVVRGAGAQLDKDASDQLVKAVKKLAKDAMPGSASTEASGVVVLSTEEDAKAGMRDDVVVTPKGLSAAIEGLNGLPVFFNGHHDGDRASLIRVFNGMATPDDGEPLTALTHPGIVLGVLHGDVKSCTDAEWLADPYKRGMWSKGNAYIDPQGKPQGWVRMSDRNGVKEGSLPPPFWRGSGQGNAAIGSIAKDAMRNLTWRITNLSRGDSGHVDALAVVAGALKLTPTGSSKSTIQNSTSSYPTAFLDFDASLGLPPGHTTDPVTGEFRPWSIYGLSYTITANGIVNEAALDAAGVMAQVLLLQGRVTTLEAPRKITLYPGGTEAAPATIGVSATIDVPNPFPGKAVLVEAQIQYLGEWGVSAWVDAPASPVASYGVACNQINETGKLVVRSGSHAVATTPVLSGGPLPIAANIASAPFRLRVYRID